ncbi:unnamed protein product [Ranitomeya imitator]|uniref:Maturin n=1 Tax=Ranitomeya imitator TaxID=111125 RepID=A0ABN9LTU7_9NEOB|nr:unnamed protein product [Ranitomeya imitator]
MDFQQLADVADKWCANTPFDLIATEESERRMDFYADPGVSFYVLCPDNGCGDNFLSTYGQALLTCLICRVTISPVTDCSCRWFSPTSHDVTTRAFESVSILVESEMYYTAFLRPYKIAAAAFVTVLRKKYANESLWNVKNTDYTRTSSVTCEKYAALLERKAEGFTSLDVTDLRRHVWSESEDCLPFLQLAQDYISSCGKKTLHEILEKVFKSFRPLLGLPDVDDDTFEEYNADVEEEEPEADHQQMGVSQQ